MSENTSTRGVCIGHIENKQSQFENTAMSQQLWRIETKEEIIKRLVPSFLTSAIPRAPTPVEHAVETVDEEENKDEIEEDVDMTTEEFGHAVADDGYGEDTSESVGNDEDCEDEDDAVEEENDEDEDDEEEEDEPDEPEDEEEEEEEETETNETEVSETIEPPEELDEPEVESDPIPLRRSKRRKK